MQNQSLTLVPVTAVIAASLAITGNTHPALAESPNSSILLVTRPASVNQPVAVVGRRHRSHHTPQKLRAIAGSISARPVRAKEPSIIPDGLIPKSVMEVNQSQSNRPVDPIDFFKVPPLDSGVKMPIKRY
ncbi:hypothetical protein [Leptothermofonsia sp. ETS-13]|uniref:hypothetical protein n=1 Tax=Leptothermofonsia sp. ETS-13 TaxID=3035696 RepID=UPI003BA30549